MEEIITEINWENFLDNYFKLFTVKKVKHESSSGITLKYEMNDIYVNCLINNNKDKILKLEFGQMVEDTRTQKTENWIKGVFKNDEPNNLTFLQTSWFGEDGESYEIKFTNFNKILISKFLQIPCYEGWREEEFYFKEFCYKIKVFTNKIQNQITLLDIGEQDIPMLTDKFDQWLRVKIYDAFWNNKKRTIKKNLVKPMTT